LGFTTTANQAVVDVAKRAVLLTPLSMPPGAVVVSTSTMVELPNCSWGVEEEEGVKVGVTVVDLVAVTLGDTLGVGEGVPEGDAPGDTVPLLLGVGLGEGSTMPCTYMPAP